MMLASPLRTPLIRTGRYGPRDPILLPGQKASGTVHEGVDCRAAVGTALYPTIAGTVAQIITGYRSSSAPGVSSGRGIFRPGSAGNLIVVRGDDGRDHNYGHLDRVLVKPGQRVHLADRIGVTGSTGVYAAHLHYGIWLEYAPDVWRSFDPTPLLPWDGDVFGELKFADKSVSAVEEDDVALTTEQAAALEWLWVNATGLEEIINRRARIDTISEHAKALYDRRGVIDHTATVVDELWRRDVAGLNSARVDVDALAARLREGLGDDIAAALAARLTN